MSICSNITGKAMKDRLLSFLNKNSFFSTIQFDFAQGKSKFLQRGFALVYKTNLKLQDCS